MILNAGGNNYATDSPTELLWENETPTVAFEAQTIELDLSEYSILYIVLKDGLETDIFTTGAAMVDETLGEQTVGLKLTSTNSFTDRNVVITESGVEVTKSAEVLIPYRIYGTRR